MARTRQPVKPSPRIHFLHIGKTGGTAIKGMVRRHRKAFRWRIALHNHEFRLADVVTGDPRWQAFFIVRDPIERFVSGFNSRLRKAMPRKLVEWDAGERAAFTRFDSANALAEALGATDAERRTAAAAAMNAIWHTKHALAWWLESAEFLEQHRDRIWYIGELAELEEDVARIRRRLELPESVRLPGEERATHRTPAGHAVELSAVGRRNIRNWYAADFPIYDWCRAARQRIIAELESG